MGNRRILIMEWLNLHSSVLDSPEFVGEEPVNQAAWIKLLRFCIGQENGGVIDNCRDWKDRKWQQLVRVTKREVETESDLWTWSEGSLIVAFYPIEKETEVQTNRLNGKKGGRPKKETNPETETKPPGFKSDNPPQTERFKIAETKRKGKERKGIERESAGEEKSSAKPPAGDPKSIVDAYPRREKTAEALAIIAKHLADGEDFEAMLAGTRAAAAVIRTLPSGHLNRYVPSAEAFFRATRWRDDPETLRRQGNQTNGQGQMSIEDAKKLLGGRASTITD